MFLNAARPDSASLPSLARDRAPFREHPLRLDRSSIPLPGGRSLDLHRDRWDGVLAPEEVAACRAYGVPLGYDCAQGGWVPLGVEDEDGAEAAFAGRAGVGSPVGTSAPAASPVKRDVGGGAGADEWRGRFEDSLGRLLEDVEERANGVPVAVEKLQRTIHRTVTDVYETGGLRNAERAHWALRSLAVRRCPMLEGRGAAADEAANPAQGIRFRRWTGDDVAAFTALLGNPRVWEFLPEPFPEPFDGETARTLIELGSLDFHHRAVAVEWQGTPVGQCLLRFDGPEDARTAEVAYWLGEDHWGQGLMGRILPAFTRQSFVEHDLDVIYAWIREDHGASVAVARRAGFSRDFFPYEAELAESMGRPGFVRYAAFRDVVLGAERPAGD